MSLANDMQVVAGNAIKALTIIGWATDAQGTPANVRLTRQEPPTIEATRTWRGEVLPNGPPSRPASVLPAPGFNELTVALDDVVGGGRCGSVFAVNTLRMTNPKDPSLRLIRPQTPYFPELVFKVAAPNRAASLGNEAAIYSEMEPLQGVSIPRCYGLFSADLGSGIVIPSLTGVTDESPATTTLSVLLLERVGEMLPLGDKLPEEGDLWDVYRDLARMGIEQPDIRYSNILQAPTSSTSFPGGVCPFHGTIHHYRVIDFDSARKTDITLKRHYYNTQGYLGPILESIKQKVILEPSEIKGKIDRPTAL